MAEDSGPIKTGVTAPDFVLRDQAAKEFKLSDFRGKRVLLSFHPAAWTPVCAEQMQSLETNKDVFESLNTVGVGISVDTIPSKKAWPKLWELPVHGCWLISGRTALWPSFSVYSGRRKVFRKEPISSWMKRAKSYS